MSHHNFKDMGITPTVKAFTGDKIKIDRILNKEIKVHDYYVKESKYERGSGQLLILQIEIDNEMRIVFTGSSTLINMIEQVPEDKFPFTTTIEKKSGSRVEFT